MITNDGKLVKFLTENMDVVVLKDNFVKDLFCLLKALEYTACTCIFWYYAQTCACIMDLLLLLLLHPHTLLPSHPHTHPHTRLLWHKKGPRKGLPHGRRHGRHQWGTGGWWWAPTPSSSTSSPNRIHHVNILGASTQATFPTLQTDQTGQLLHNTRMEAKEHITPPPLSSTE